MQTQSARIRPTPLVALATAAVLCGPPALAQEASPPSTISGLGLQASDASWPRWQARLGLSAPQAQPSGARRFEPEPAPAWGGSSALPSLSLLGDYYFTQQGLAPGSRYSGGFRATGGVFVGSRAASWSVLPGAGTGLSGGFSAERRNFNLWNPPAAGDTDSAGSVPYLGVGYTGLRSLKGTGGGWAFSADVGVMALKPRSAVRFGQALGGQNGLGDTGRDTQLSPLLQLGASYAF
jgi:hypothetical protein